ASLVLSDPATTYYYTLSLHDALRIYLACGVEVHVAGRLAGRDLAVVERGGAAVREADDHEAAAADVAGARVSDAEREADRDRGRSEEHTSELQSRENLVCRLLLEKKK